MQRVIDVKILIVQHCLINVIMGKEKSVCAIYANVLYECPKFCGLCDRYDEMKKYSKDSITWK
jgi:hypothetical protein